jgi:alcohol dehydrogenase
MRTINLSFPKRLSIGPGSFRQFLKDTNGLELNRIFILSIPEIQPVLRPFLEELEQGKSELFVDLSLRNEPTVSDFNRLLDLARDFKPDLVLGIGGGSVLDVAKLVAAQLDNNQSLSDIVGVNLLTGRRILLACVPTTSGTGSEVSPNAILLDEKENMKKGIVSPHLVPDLCYVDPELTMTVPPSVTAATGVDAFTHCLEAYVNKNSHPVIDNYALEGMRLIAGSLKAAVEDGGNLEARNDLSTGSLYGGMCLGPVNTTAIHALSYPMGSNFRIPHGLSNAMLLPAVMEFNLPVAVDRYAKVAELLGVRENSGLEARARGGIDAVRSLMASCGIPSSISELGIPRDAIPEMAASAMKVQRLLINNPREVRIEDAFRIYSNAF